MGQAVAVDDPGEHDACECAHLGAVHSAVAPFPCLGDVTTPGKHHRIPRIEACPCEGFRGAGVELPPPRMTVKPAALVARGLASPVLGQPKSPLGWLIMIADAAKLKIPPGLDPGSLVGPRGFAQPAERIRCAVEAIAEGAANPIVYERSTVAMGAIERLRVIVDRLTPVRGALPAPRRMQPGGPGVSGEPPRQPPRQPPSKACCPGIQHPLSRRPTCDVDTGGRRCEACTREWKRCNWQDKKAQYASAQHVAGTRPKGRYVYCVRCRGRMAKTPDEERFTCEACDEIEPKSSPHVPAVPAAAAPVERAPAPATPSGTPADTPAFHRFTPAWAAALEAAHAPLLDERFLGPDLVLAVLAGAGVPLHEDEILRRVTMLHREVKRAALTLGLFAMALRGEVALALEGDTVKWKAAAPSVDKPKGS